MERSPQSETVGVSRTLLFVCSAYLVGLLGVTGWGWAAATLFLLADASYLDKLGLGEGDSVLPTMVTYGLPLAFVVLVCTLLAWRLDGAGFRLAPWRWMFGAGAIFLVSFGLGALGLLFLG